MAEKPQDWNTSIDKSGAYKRKATTHRNTIEEGGEFPPEAGRYHLHVALACPWACGTLTMLHDKGLEEVISFSVVHPTWGKTKPADKNDPHCGWVYRVPGDPPVPNTAGHGENDIDDKCIPDTVTNCKNIREVYALGGDTKGPFSTPVLFDTKTKQIVNNESGEILKIFNSAFNKFAKNPELDLWPSDDAEQARLQKLNDDLVYPNINNGVYRAGFATKQEVYVREVGQVFDALEKVDAMLGQTRYMGGDKFTWLDLRLFHTLVRFDPVYVVYFKTSEKRVADYPNLLGFIRDVYQSKAAIRQWINFKHIKMHYFTSHPNLNTYGIIPTHDGADLTLPHGRDGRSCSVM